MNKNEKFVVTINREMGSGGRSVGRKLAERLNVKYYDKAVIEGLTKKFGVGVENIENMKAQKASWWNNIDQFFKDNQFSDLVEQENLMTNENVVKAEKEILFDLAKEGSCVVAGRSGFLVFKDTPNHLSIFIQASMESRIERVMRRQNLSRKDAIAAIERVDEGRENFIKKNAKTTRYDSRNYDIVLRMDGLTEDDAVEIIMNYIDRTSK
ncbi:MAG: cytidylate kinase-like family protein [Bacteroidales bacterium]|nr:cytidylate kinase-like family protein [Bacteroidales bacterium]MBR1517638.1 cytidylate kinase-like family protein [Bacteroidales bacterium]